MKHLVVIALAFAAGPAFPDCAADRVDLRGPFGTASFRVDVADEPDERAQGLMFVEELRPNEGMLFVFERAGPVSFWMRNTLIPLDMLFAGEDGVVRRVHENAVPLDETGIPGGDDIRYVLEIPGGVSAMLGVAEGAQMRHPAIAEPAWPCGEVEDEVEDAAPRE
ncbi:hypothetical protein BCF33_0683 [Hasllibacter halocynthiae]|uniref:DUF192 domain-containing protein n=1 Tax=Hasllibacter halocynthiae TaxID=595589 RepID=A0A2T0X7Z1_9RHOB|nr:DUF192 domain-containing protein [Hasllibacter halocynthiae]PRY95071.1 hypothetical protein BCF33_0683 [Hasllibacter halocynthiae]